MRDLGAIIESAYLLFAPYTLGPALDLCKVCCVTDADERELLATPLHQVSRELLYRAYLGSARSGSDQEQWEIKHFLPRLLELINQFEFPCISPEVALNRINLNQQYWPAAEQALLSEFALAYVRQSVQQYPLPRRTSLPELLLLFGLAYFDLAPLLQAWTATDTPASIAHFSDLLLYELRFTSAGAIKLTSAFSQPHINAQITAWLTSSTSQAVWAARLESAIVYGQLPAEEAARVSMAYEVLTKAL